MWSQVRCKEYIKRVLDRSKNDAGASFVPFRERSFLTTSWLLKELLNEKQITEEQYTSELLDLLNLHTPDELFLILEQANPDIPDLIGGIFERDSSIITSNMIDASEDVFYNEIHDYNLINSVAFLDDEKVTGMDFLIYLYGLNTKFKLGYPTKNLFNIVYVGLHRALGLTDPTISGEHEFCGVVTADNWSCLVAVVSDSQALRGDTFIRLHSYFIEEGQLGLFPVICFCPPISRIANTLANSGNNIFYVWGLSGVVFFNTLNHLVTQFGSELVQRKFPAFFDNTNSRKGAYQVRSAFAKLKLEIEKEAAIQHQGKLIKLAAIVKSKGIYKVAIVQESSGDFLPTHMVSSRENFPSSQIVAFFDNKGISVKKAEFLPIVSEAEGEDDSSDASELFCVFGVPSSRSRLPANISHFGKVSWLSIADAEDALSNSSDLSMLQRADDLTSQYLP